MKREHPGSDKLLPAKPRSPQWDRLIRELGGIVGRENVLSSRRDLLAYSYDATPERRLPDAVVFPSSAREIAAVMKLARREGLPVIPRGAGTNLSGGTLPLRGGIVLGLARLNRILNIDIANQRVVVEPGVINLDLQNALAPLGYTFAPDPASQKASTLGGNVGEDAGGPHCLKYGVTTNHVLGMELVLVDGEIVEAGGALEDNPGYDLAGVMVGSEGTLGVITQLVLRIIRLPEAYQTMLAVYETLEDAGQTVSDIIAAGIIPATLELMDKPVLRAVEESVHAGYPTDAEAVLLIEVDGIRDGLERQAQQISEFCQSNRVREVRLARTAAERDGMWAGRRGAFGSVARVRPAYRQQDGTVPRTRLVEMLGRVRKIVADHNLIVGNVAHAGDGNLHPLIMFDDADADESARVERAGKQILAECVKLGGTLTGEHGIGLEKRELMPLLFSETSLWAMKRVKEAFDPEGVLNPDKIFPLGPAAEPASSAETREVAS